MAKQKSPSKRAPPAQRGPSRKAAQAAKQASHSRGLMKERISVLETEVRLLRVLHESLLDEIRELMQGPTNLISENKQL